MAGPAWLGIGAQRSGTTWFTRLLVQHPRVALPAGARKELHAFSRPLVEGPDALDIDGYRRSFPDADDVLRGEFTPYYLRGMWIPALIQSILPEDAPIVVVLRDPVERFVSALKWYVERHRYPGDAGEADRWIRPRAADCQWGGMYATQLALWTSVLGADRFHVMQYEAVRQDPQGAVERIWRALGLDPVPLTEVAQASRTTSSPAPEVAQLPGLREALVATYAPEVARLEAEWSIDRALWPNFTGA